ncbi:type I-E CRISPR-associated protein Cas5/CasD [Denitratisoma oestradiolicum]|nr:type I-E CRISPR-associated protein Cas5/CasD [Denitratisoma oestradiolicum]
MFRLYGPLASWGDIAVGEVRPSFERPSKSAVLGLAAAALGLRRDDEDGQHRLAQDYGYAVEVQSFGQPLRDYHTVQRPPQRKGADYVSRREELLAVPKEDLATTLSYRDYWQDASYIACLWAKGDTPIYPLVEMASALQRPHYVLYLGRKSCPLALPLQPQIVEADSISAAFDGAMFKDDIFEHLSKGERIRFSDEKLGDTVMKLIRRDQPDSRRRWQFSEREEYRLTVIEEGAQ